MPARLTKLFAGLAAVAALAVGGSALAGAANSPTPASPPAVSAPADTTKQGDQTAPDTDGAASEPSSESASSESSTEAADPSDGPGGHADEPGNANADHQFQGEE
jgi:hypothetical protein